MKKLILVLISFFIATASMAELPFSKGLNLAGWFVYTNTGTPVDFGRFVETDIADYKSLGVDYVRLPVDFYTQNGGAPNYVVNASILSYLDQAIAMMERQKMYVIIDMQPSANEVACADKNFPALLNKVWAQLASRYKDKSDYIMYEIENEPSGWSTAAWGAIQQTVLTTIRTKDTKHKVVLSASWWGTSLEMDQLPYYTDANVIYSFHFYEPGIFTHQGVDWYEPTLACVKELPFPYSAAKMPTMPSCIASNYWADEFKTYGTIGTVAAVKATLDKAILFKNTRGVDVLCGEIGVYNAAVLPVDRNNYYRTVCNYLSSAGIPYSNWGCKDEFGIYKVGNKTYKFPADLNLDMLSAMGLKIQDTTSTPPVLYPTPIVLLPKVSITPNPVISNAVLTLYLPNTAQIRATIYDMGGRTIKNIANAYLSAGSYSIEWNVRDNNGRYVKAGTYICSVVVSGKSYSVKFIIKSR